MREGRRERREEREHRERAARERRKADGGGTGRGRRRREPESTPAEQLQALLARALNPFDVCDATLRRLEHSVLHEASPDHGRRHGGPHAPVTAAVPDPWWGCFRHLFLLRDGTSELLWELRYEDPSADGRLLSEVYEREHELRQAEQRVPGRHGLGSAYGWSDEAVSGTEGAGAEDAGPEDVGDEGCGGAVGGLDGGGHEVGLGNAPFTADAFTDEAFTADGIVDGGIADDGIADGGFADEGGGFPDDGAAGFADEGDGAAGEGSAEGVPHELRYGFRPFGPVPDMPWLPRQRCYAEGSSPDHARRLLRRAENPDRPGDEVLRLLDTAQAHEIVHVPRPHGLVHELHVWCSVYEHAFLLADGSELSLYELEHDLSTTGRLVCEVYLEESTADRAAHRHARDRGFDL